MRKISLSFALLFVTIATRAADPALTLDGDGTRQSPYLIGTAADVLQLATACNGASSTTSGHYSGKYFCLTADIDMAGIEGFTGIASAPADKSTSYSTYHFDGKFDGRGYRIKNLKINGLVYKDDGSLNTATGANGSRRYVGFFGALGTGAEVSNLIIDSSCRFVAYSYVGGIAGYMGTDAFVKNCANYGEIVSMYTDCGGIAGQQGTTSAKTGGFINCFNAGTIICSSNQAGGIVGKTSYGEITNCANVGQVLCYNYNKLQAANGQTKAGGIVGYNSYTVMKDCFNAGDVYAMKETAGGMAGIIAENSTKGGMKSCLNVGFVYGALGYNCGYLAGMSYSVSSSLKTIQNCYYDAQLLNNLFGANSIEFAENPVINRMQTAQLTSGQKLAGLEDWVYKTGSYPVPAGLDYPELFAAAATYVKIPAGQDADRLTGTAAASDGTVMALEKPTDLFTLNGSGIVAHPSLGDGVGVMTLANGNFKRHLILSTYTIPFSGRGTAASPYLINNKEDLIKLADLTNDMRQKWTGSYFRLTSDIDMAGETRFMGIGCAPDTVNNFGSSYRLQFRGIFDGDNHKVSNLVCDWVRFASDSTYIDWRKGGYYMSGFFGTLGEGAEIRNFTIDRSCKYRVWMYSGGLASMARGNAKIENCHVGAEITAYNRYVGGIIGEDNTTGSVEIRNCTFTGRIIANYDYVGGMIGFGQNANSRIVSCVNAGAIEAYRFDNKALTSNTATLNRIAGIAGAFRGKIMYCASYGPITLTPHPYTSSKMVGCGGLVGQISNYSEEAAMQYNFTSSQIYVTSPFPAVSQIGAIVGDYYVQPKEIYCNSKANYSDTTLCAVKVMVGHSTPDTIAAPNSFHGLSTSEFTSGTPVDSLAQYFTFENGYYPMPKTLAANPDVRVAAATFMNVTSSQGGYILSLFPGAVCLFNNVMPLTGTLQDGTVFYVKDNALKMRNVREEASDVLTLTNGWFHTLYPVHKQIGLGVDQMLDITDPVIDTYYYNTAGIRIINPAPGTAVVAVSHTLSGKRIIRKIVVH